MMDERDCSLAGWNALTKTDAIQCARIMRVLIYTHRSGYQCQRTISRILNRPERMALPSYIAQGKSPQAQGSFAIER